MYPRQHTIDHPKLKDLLDKKTALVLEGRQISEDIEDIELGQTVIDNQIKELESKVDLKEFEAKAEDTTKRMQALMEEANNIQKEIYAKLKAEIPSDLGEKYDKNQKLKEGLENKRNKLGLKIQKLKDLIIPLTQEVVKPLLEDEFEDLQDVRVENGEVIVEVISHLENWKAERAKKLDK